MSIKMQRYTGMKCKSKTDRILFNLIFQTHGIMDGCEVGMSAVNAITVQAGTMFAMGTELIVEQEAVVVKLATSGSMKGRMKVVLDMTQTDNPVSFVSEVAASADVFPELVQNDINYDSTGIYEYVLATYDCTETTISNVELVEKVLLGLGDIITELNNNLNVHYNTETDYIEVLADGVWVQAINCGLKNVNMLSNLWTATNNNTVTSIVENDNEVKITLTGTNSSTVEQLINAYLESPLFDLTQYNTLNLIGSFYTLTETFGGDYLPKISVISESGQEKATYSPTEKGVVPFEKGLDISAISGKCKLRIAVYGYRYSNNTNPNNKGTYVDLTNAVLGK